MGGGGEKKQELFVKDKIPLRETPSKLKSLRKGNQLARKALVCSSNLGLDARPHLQPAAMAASPAVLKPSQETRRSTWKFLKEAAIISRQSSVTTMRLKLISSSSGQPSAAAATHGAAAAPQAGGTRPKSAKWGLPLTSTARTAGKRSTASCGDAA